MNDIFGDIVRSLNEKNLLKIALINSRFFRDAKKVKLNINKHYREREGVQLCRYCKKNNIISLSILIKKYYNDYYPYDWTELDHGLGAACRGGNKDLIDLMISNGANNWNYGLKGACIGGHRDLIDLMISKGASNWN